MNELHQHKMEREAEHIMTTRSMQGMFGGECEWVVFVDQITD